MKTVNKRNFFLKKEKEKMSHKKSKKPGVALQNVRPFTRLDGARIVKSYPLG